MNTMLIIIVLLVAILFILLLNWAKCDKSCPYITSEQNATTPVGKCLFTCDLENDLCYNKCSKNDDQCVRDCYDKKYQCYTDCLTALPEKSFTCKCE